MSLPPINGELTLDHVRQVDRLVHDHFTYVSDAALRDTWTSFHKQVLAGEQVRGDCDDKSQTALQILYLRGAPKAALYRALVSSTGEAIDHMVGLVRLPNGDFWTVGDTFGPPCRVSGDRITDSKRNHKIIETAQVSRGRRFVKWKAAPKGRETTATAMGMRASESALAFMRAHEKFVAIPYDDFRPRYVLKPGDQILGTLTVGYGHTGADVQIGKKITKAEGERLFAKDVERFEKAVRRMVRVDLEQCQFDALVSFAFNCGEENLRKSTLLKLVNAGAADHEIQAQFRRWTRSKGKVLAGLVKRRNAEAAMWAGEVVTHGAIEAAFRAPEISCEATVKEDEKARKSPDIYLASGTAAGGGGLAIWTAVMDALNDFRDSAADLSLVYSLVGVAIAICGAILLYKRLREIWSAKR